MKVIQPADSTQARSLPKYDFPLYMVNATPATHHIMNMKVETVQEKEDLCITDDDTIVFMCPKYFGGPSADMWGSESMKTRYNNIGLFEVKSRTLKKHHLKKLWLQSKTVFINILIKLNSLM